MTKLNQIIALVNGTKTRTTKAITEVYHKLQKDALLSGISRKYNPKDEEGERLPPEQKLVQYRVSTAMEEAQEAIGHLIDLVALQDRANCEAMASVVVSGRTISRDVPVTTMLFLEKQLTDLHTMFTKLPTLDPGEEWARSATADCYATSVTQTTRTKKVPKAFVKYEATKEHPAQVDAFTEDVIVGTWDTVKFSGAIPEDEKKALIRRCEELQDAVKRAREEANSIEVDDKVEVAKPLFDYLFFGNTTV